MKLALLPNREMVPGLLGKLIGVVTGGGGKDTAISTIALVLLGPVAVEVNMTLLLLSATLPPASPASLLRKTV